ncbi:MAG: large membrane associated protein, partial [Leifsonia sp.]
LCSAPGIIDMTAAGPFPDLQLQGSYPITEEQWTTTNRYYYCFVNRAGGEPITASVAGPGPAA